MSIVKKFTNFIKKIYNYIKSKKTETDIERELVNMGILKTESPIFTFTKPEELLYTKDNPISKFNSQNF